jgi:hypothetical protein
MFRSGRTGCEVGAAAAGAAVWKTSKGNKAHGRTTRARNVGNGEPSALASKDLRNASKS